MDNPRGWYSRGYLPHIDAGDKATMVNWRLNDAVPTEVIELWRSELRQEEDAKQIRELMKRIEIFADQGMGECHMADPRVARVVQEAILSTHGKTAILHAWVVMPNHVHVLLTPKGVPLPKLMQQIKGASSFAANRILRRSGSLWQRDYFDRQIRNEEHFEKVVQYIEWNPVKAKLCTDPSHWAWGTGSPEVRKRLSPPLPGSAGL